ncbi:MAG: twin-arginine translocase subunit TatC [Isosphaeraceae bacterium]|nr:twin-arginine translocase subunit TatC [Isosphaeraceae bacterium]
MPTDNDLFNEEQTMVAMSFGEHIEELRARLILGLLGLMVGVVIVFVPPLNIGKRIMTKMEEPATGALTKFYTEQAIARAKEADATNAQLAPVQANIPADIFVEQLRKIAPDLKLPDPATLKEQTVSLPVTYGQAGIIKMVDTTVRPSTSLITLAPLEAMTIFFMVCVIAGLVLSSPWVFYQAWAFVAAGLYRHERHYVMRYLPFSLGLFLGGVLLCFFFVLPITLSFLLEFNVWLGLEPTLRLTDWMSFATILPLVFGICFQTPLIMLLLERIGILTVEDFRAKRKMAILIIVIAGAVLTPGQDPFSQVLLAGPMIILYELGILLVSQGRKKPLADVGE